MRHPFCDCVAFKPEMHCDVEIVIFFFSLLEMMYCRIVYKAAKSFMSGRIENQIRYSAYLFAYPTFFANDLRSGLESQL